jgi:hypothetical protein
MSPMSAPELSAEERATVERFEAAPAAEESLRERVARALYIASHVPGGNSLSWNHWNGLADAAIAVLSGPSSDAEQAVERVLALADFHAECCEYVKVRDLRAALAGD